jgi:RHS repeat-associated protein
VTTYTYNKRGLLEQKTTPDAGTVNYKYDNNGSLRYMRDANLAAATRYLAYTYDFAGRVTREETCHGSMIPTSLTQSCTSSQQAIVYTYDIANVPTGVTFTVNNPLGRLTKVDFQGGYYLYSYDNNGNIERMYNKLDGLAGRTITYNYNRLGEVTFRHMSGNIYRWWYTYNPLGQLKLVRSNTTTTQVTDADYSAYWPAGMVQTEVLGNQTISYGYDARDRITDINNVNSGSHRFSARYSYLMNGNIDQAIFYQPTSPLQGQEKYRYSYTYDNRNQLTAAQYEYDNQGWENNNLYRIFGIQYDKDGKILMKDFDNGPGRDEYNYSYQSGKSRLSSIDGTYSPVSMSIGYDANGNMTTMNGMGYDITGTSYSWRNQPLGITKGGSTTYNYIYDHMGHRVYKEEGNDIHYLRGAYGEVLAVYQNGSIDHWNIVRPDGAVIGRREGSTRYYYHRDHLGSTRAVVTSGGSVTEVYDYMPFGDMMEDRITTSSGGAREKFTSHEFDDEVDLYYMQWRRYIPRFGVFTGVDPMTDVFPSWSPYNYAMNNPLIFIDPDGRSPVCGAYQNCDNTYEIGSIVSNRLGSWQYKGNDQWETLSLAENVTEITSTIGHAWHWFTNTLDEFYNFGDRTIAENKFNVISISVMDNPGTWLVGGLAVGSLARGTGAMAAKGGSQLSTRFVSTSKGLTDLQPTLNRIASGGKFSHRNDGSIFKNLEGLLPKQNTGFYREFVHPTPRVTGPGPMRIVTGQNGKIWFTPDHYKTFIPIR